MRATAVVVVLLAVVACTRGPNRPRPSTGAIAGLVRDLKTGDPVAMAEIKLHGGAQPVRVVSTLNGLYDIDKVAPGTYRIVGQYAGQTIEIKNIVVHLGVATYVDLLFTLGDPQPILVDFGDPRAGEINRYRPTHIAPTASLIEGTVNDVETRSRVAGAVVTAVSAVNQHTEQTISDEQGRYRFDVTPGIYSVSAYYNIGQRAQVEVQRNQIEVAPAEAVVVPLWVELSR